MLFVSTYLAHWGDVDIDHGGDELRKEINRWIFLNDNGY